MSKLSRYSFLLAILSSLLIAQVLTAQDGVNGNLVTAKWVANNLHNPNVLILDTTVGQSYATKHIPGAVDVDLYSYVGETPTAEMEQRLRSWGVSPGRKIVLYDQGGSMMATRSFYALYYYGVPAKNLFVLDGGLAKWQELGYPVTKDATVAKPGTFKISKVKEEVRVRLPEVLAASGDPARNALVDALDAKWHYGETSPFDRAGHIPNSVMLPSADFYNADKTFKSPEDITRMLTYVGVRPDQQVFTYCGGGVAASVPFFAIKFILHYPVVKLYQESEIGWLSDQRQLPYWTYDAPFLLRDSRWLQWTGGQILRTFASSRVSIVDVRQADVFNQGHVPFALNIPADVFRANIATPEKLNAILGPAGIDASHEAVVISGGGLTKESALAFVMLEKAGQKRVSILTDSMDQWSKLGFPLKKEPTVVAQRKSPHDLAIPPTTYPADTRKDVIIVDATAAKSLYPKVFIASGKDVLAKAPEGKVVHVPYSDLINADGTPRAAKEISSILAKADVPRYAELVCVSDDPGEAAVNYVILKLMGYPDVKVLVI